MKASAATLTSTSMKVQCRCEVELTPGRAFVRFAFWLSDEEGWQSAGVLTFTPAIWLGLLAQIQSRWQVEVVEARIDTIWVPDVVEALLSSTVEAPEPVEVERPDPFTDLIGPDDEDDPIIAVD